MTAPNRATLWGKTLVAELAESGIGAACIAPGSRSTPLTIAFADHPDVETFSVLDERSAAFFALGRARRTGEPAAVVCTSGTAAANFHPAVVEADESGVPLLVLTADRPAELQDSGANQTVDQERLYGDAVRWYRRLPEPAPEARRLRSLRVSAARAVAGTVGPDPGPVHLNVPLAKPLEPSEVPSDVPEGFATDAPLAVEGRPGPFVRTSRGRPTPDGAVLDGFARAIEGADRGLLVVGPRNPDSEAAGAIREFAAAVGWPVLADPLSGLRYGPHVDELPICGGYDAYLDAAESWPGPDAVVRFGASPTSKALRRYLREGDARQIIVDPSGDWPEAEFTATDRVVADPAATASGLAARVSSTDSSGPVPETDADPDGGPGWRDRFEAAEREHWAVVEDGLAERPFEGGVLATAVREAPDPATLFVSNSMPVRDCDRFGRPRAAELTVLGNRGASGIDGITSSALGAGSADDAPLVLVTGDLAFYHDMNGLLSVERCNVDATVVLVNNDGGGIFHMLPIERFDPPFTEQFRTPHGLDFEPAADLYGLGYDRFEDVDAFESAYRKSVRDDGTSVLEVAVDAESSHRLREELAGRLRERLP